MTQVFNISVDSLSQDILQSFDYDWRGSIHIQAVNQREGKLQRPRMVAVGVDEDIVCRQICQRASYPIPLWPEHEDYVVLRI